MSHRLLSIAVIGAAVVLGALGCGSDTEACPVCGPLGPPGSIVALPGITIAVHNDQGQAIAQGTSVVLVGRADSVGQLAFPDSATVAVFVGAGTYTLRVSKPLYRDTTLSNVVVQNGDFGTVQTTKVSVTLHPAASGAVVRSVALYGAAFLERPGAEARLAAVVDAGSGVSHAVRWQIDDPTVASVDQQGVVVAQCSMRGGTATVTARSLADPGVSAFARLAVAPADSC